MNIKAFGFVFVALSLLLMWALAVPLQMGRTGFYIGISVFVVTWFVWIVYSIKEK